MLEPCWQVAWESTVKKRGKYSFPSKFKLYRFTRDDDVVRRAQAVLHGHGKVGVKGEGVHDVAANLKQSEGK